MTSNLPDEIGSRTIASTLAAFGLACAISAAPPVGAAAEFACASGATLATGRTDPDLLADEASNGVRAFWCERYDSYGTATRTGPYWETYSNGRIRTRAHYVDSQLQGPVSIYDQDGPLFLRGFLEAGEWSGVFELFHWNGSVWLEAHFEAGQLEGALRTRFPDGALESETRYQAGREDGLARSFYPTAAGGRLRSEAHVEADQLVGRQRLLDRKGELIRTIDWNTGPIAWRRAKNLPAAADPAAPDRASTKRELDLRD